MKTIVILFLALLGCGGCDGKVTVVDQKIRERLFQECMKALPAGPNSTRYNDWAEVVERCGDVAYYGSIRRILKDSVTKDMVEK